MKNVLLNQETLSWFVSMDPFEKRDMLLLPGSFGFGSFVEEQKEDIPAGLIICSEEEDRLVIDWIYTSPEYRGLGIASELMYMAFEEASARELSEVVAAVSDEYEDNDLGWDTWGFFDNEVFSEVEESGSVLRLRYEDLDKKIRMEEKLYREAIESNNICTLAELSALKLKNAVSSLKKKYGKFAVISVERALAAADPDVSILFKTEDDVTGAFLIRKAGHTWYPFWLEGQKEEDKVQMIRAALYQSEEACHLGDDIEIRFRKPVSRSVAGKVGLPGTEYEVTCLLARMDAFHRQKQLTNEAL